MHMSVTATSTGYSRFQVPCPTSAKQKIKPTNQVQALRNVTECGEFDWSVWFLALLPWDKQPESTALLWAVMASFLKGELIVDNQ